MTDLYPVVIPPLEYVRRSLKFTCCGEGLYTDDWLYDAHPEKFFPPRATKTNLHHKEVERKPTSYWKVQCAFRGLNQSGAIPDLQLRFREAKKKILPELKAAETQLNKEFKKKNKASRDASWNSLKTVEQKAKANPPKFLAEAFPKGKTSKSATLATFVVKSAYSVRLALRTAAESAGPECVSSDTPWTAGQKPTPDRWIITGKTRDAVSDQMREIEQKAAPSRTGGGEPKAKKARGSKDSKRSPTKSALLKATPRSMSMAAMLPKPKQSTLAKVNQTEQTAAKIAFPSAPLHYEPHRSSFNLHDYSSAPSAEAPRTKQTARKSAFPDPSETESEDLPTKAPRTKQTASKTAISLLPSLSSSTISKGENAWDAMPAARSKLLVQNLRMDGAIKAIRL